MKIILIFLIALSVAILFLFPRWEDKSQKGFAPLEKKVDHLSHNQKEINIKSDISKNQTKKNEVKNNKNLNRKSLSKQESKNDLLSSSLAAIERQDIENEMIKSSSKEVDIKVHQMINTGIVDLELSENKRAPGAIERIKSAFRVAAARNLKSEVPGIISVLEHHLSDVDLKIEGIKALGHLNSDQSKKYLREYTTTDEFVKGQVLLSRAMLNDKDAFGVAIDLLNSLDDELQESALNSLMLLVDNRNQYELFKAIKHVRPVNHIALAMTLQTINTPESQSELEKFEKKYGEFVQ